MTRLPNNVSRNRRIAYWALFIAVGAIIWSLEEFLPRPLPWAKPGLANIATLIALFILGPVDAIIVAVGRVLVASLVLGRIGTPAFFMSISGAAAASLSMAGISKARLGISIYGISLSGAMAHALAQLGAAAILVFSPEVIFASLPLVLLPSVLAGIAVGWLSARLMKALPASASGLKGLRRPD